VAAADVGDPPPGLEPGLDPVKGRDPGLDQVGPVAGGEEHLAAVEDLGVLLVPADPGAGSASAKACSSGRLKRPLAGS
jgi:hypothetical protein